MAQVAAYAAPSARAPLGPHTIQRRDPGPHDVQIEILFCGVCHSDIHQVRAEWGDAIFPMVPGHEIVGRVTKVGTSVSKFVVGDHGQEDQIIPGVALIELGHHRSE